MNVKGTYQESHSQSEIDILAASEHVFRWDGTTESGIRAVAGTYFYRLHCDGREASRKMVLLTPSLP